MPNTVPGAAVDSVTPSNENIPDSDSLQLDTPSMRKAGGGIGPSKQQGNHECLFFFEDEVFKIERSGRVSFGVITETTESYSSDEEEDIDEALNRGEVRVAFYPDGREIIQTEQSIGLADRALMPGDVVRRLLPGQKHLTGQSGYVRDVSMRADVKVLGTKYIIKNVPSERLRQISSWSRDLPVCMGSWIGTIVNVDESAILKAANGARLEITSNDFHKFKDAYGPSIREVFNPNIYYPGNIIIGRLPPSDRVKNLTPEIALPGNRKSRSAYTVESAKTTSITVAWSCKASTLCDTGIETDPLKQPKSCIKGNDLLNVKRLNLYESYMLQIHDRFYLNYTKCDTLVNCTDWEEEQELTYVSIFENQKSVDITHSTGDLVEASPSGSFSTRIARNMAKFRKLLKKSSASRLNRSQAESTHDRANLSNTLPTTKTHGDETSDSMDDEEYDDYVPDPEAEPETEASLGPTTKLLLETPASTASNGRAITAPRILNRYFKRRHAKKKLRTSKKTLATPLARKVTDPKDGDELFVETLVVRSAVTVVWQDGTVETDVPSTQLYPIHHLDNHEFFPGDFVSKCNDLGPSQTDYGVIQSVDHDERIAKVKWFNIYGNMDNPVPTCREVEELSVYDLKDHTDYQYRPGTLVIRVSNFSGEDANSTAGQVIDNFPDGRVRVWWANGHITMCYPQDLFEINHNDHDIDGDDSDGSENSWETQSVNSSIDEDHIISGVECAKDAIKCLEKMFRVLPAERKSLILNELLAIYKNCRYLDRLLGTNLFDEEHFQGILRRKQLLDNDTASAEQVVNVAEDTTTPMVLVNSESPAEAAMPPGKRKSSCNIDGVLCKKSSDGTPGNSVEEQLDENLPMPANVELSNSETNLTTNELIGKYRDQYANMLELARVNMLKAFEKQKNKHDSGIFSRGENGCSDYTFVDNAEETAVNAEVKDDKVKSDSNTSIELVAPRTADACEIFCFLMNEQMTKCHKVIMEAYGKIDKGCNDTGNTDGDVSDAEEAKEGETATAGSADEANEQDDNNEEVVDEQEQEKNPKEEEKLKTNLPEQVNELAADVVEQALNMNSLSESLPELENPVACSSRSESPAEFVRSPSPISSNCFEVLPIAPITHRFFGTILQPANRSQYQHAIQREYHLLQAALPEGVSVRAYEDRMDLMSVMMVGPKCTPYENALFFFDIQMGREFPKSPPTCHYISYCTDRLNPNLYEEGRVCISLLGTWTGRNTEVWTPVSTMLQVLVSIQGLILVDEPYYNEAGYEKQKGTQLGNENSRVYNEMVVIKVAHSTVKQLQNPPCIFRKELFEHYKQYGNELHSRMQAWSDYSSMAQQLQITNVKDMPAEHAAICAVPEFPLLPCSRGFCIGLKGVLKTLRSELDSVTVTEIAAPNCNTAPRAAPEEV